MNWYKITQKILPSLRGLAYEALKYPTFEDFEHAYCGEIRHGQYWHFTDNPNFMIDLEKGPRDMSSMNPLGNTMAKGKLMVTSYPDEWDSYYNYGDHGKTRPWAAEIDMSQVPKEAYRQVNRGFGNEFIIFDTSKAKVIRVLPVEKARRAWTTRHCKIPGSEEQLKEFYDQAWELKKQSKI